MYDLKSIMLILLYPRYIDHPYDILDPYHFIQWCFRHLDDDLWGISYMLQWIKIKKSNVLFGKQKFENL